MKGGKRKKQRLQWKKRRRDRSILRQNERSRKKKNTFGTDSFLPPVFRFPFPISMLITPIAGLLDSIIDGNYQI